MRLTILGDYGIEPSFCQEKKRRRFDSLPVPVYGQGMDRMEGRTG